MKQAIVVRTDVKMDKGKLASQVAHASLAAFLKVGALTRKFWLMEGMKKIVLKVSSKEELLELRKVAKREKIPSEIITDAGKTQIPSGTVTALGIGPGDDSKIDKIVGHLKLL